MNFQSVRFIKSTDHDFSTILKERVNHYFKSNDISRNCNKNMVAKTVFMLTLFIVPMVILNSGLINEVSWLFFVYFVGALGKSGIGMNVMHDANHGSYSKNKYVNKYLSYSMNLIGGNSELWRIKHNVLHHTYTNIDGLDDDINAPAFLRFSPNKKLNWIHRFQHFYAWFFYGLSMISWIAVKDYVSTFHFKKLGFFDKKNEFGKQLMNVFLWKLVYLSYTLIIPMIILPFSPGLVFLGFFLMQFVTGLIITTVFQTAHVMPDTEFPEQTEEGVIYNEWLIHQLETTANFAPKSKLFSWFIGGLNFQVEHHLFPNICHVHYKKISAIVKQTAEEYQVPYNNYNTFVSAVLGHVDMLRQLGRPV